MDVTNFILFVSELPINMPPKKGHCNDIESSSTAVKRIRIVPDKNQSDATTVMCEDCSPILKSLETLKNHKKAMHENEKFICTDCGESFESIRQLNNHRGNTSPFFVKSATKVFPRIASRDT